MIYKTANNLYNNEFKSQFKKPASNGKPKQ